jgi:peroxiredoxin
VNSGLNYAFPLRTFVGKLIFSDLGVSFMTLSVGDPVPQLSLYDQNRKLRNIADFTSEGKVVFAFFAGAFTSVCTKEMCTFRDSYTRLSPLAQVVGISVDSPFALRGFAEKNGLNFPLLSDYGRQAISAFGVEFKDFLGMQGYTVARRSIFVAGKDGRFKYVWLAPDQGVEPNYSEIEEALARVI